MPAFATAAILSAVWFLLLAGLGTFFPFYTLYLTRSAHLDSQRAGMVMALMPLVGMLAQPAWGHLADRTGSRTNVLVALSLGAALGYLLLFFANGFEQLLAATALLALCASPLVPMCTAVSLALLAPHGAHAFGRVRVWGTLGFLAAVAAYPSLAARAEAALGPGRDVMFPVAAALTLSAALFAMLLPRGGTAALRAEHGEARTLLTHGPFARVLFLVLAAYLFLHGPLVFFPLFVGTLGGGAETVSRMWVLMLVLEVPLIALVGSGYQRLGSRTLLAIGVGAGALRWLVSGFATNRTLIDAVQILHGVNVVGLIIGASLYVEAVVPERLRATAQGWLSMVGVSVGGISSTLACGWLIAHFGAAAPARFGGLGALALTLAVPLLVPPPARSGHARHATGSASDIASVEI